MHICMGADVLNQEFITKYLADGEQKFYRSLLIYALNKLIVIEKTGSVEGELPNLEFLNYYDQFIISYRRGGESTYLDLARLFRKAGHKIYRIMLKKKMTEINVRFLNLV